MHSSPPPEAYSRVTNSQRFHGIHEFAQGWIAKLIEAYDVETLDATDHEIERLSIARVIKTVRLIPRETKAASISVTFTDFPGLFLKVGDSDVSSFPACGCDACDESLDDETARFSHMVQSTIEGGFTERERGVFRQFSEREFRDKSGTAVSWGSSRLPFELRRLIKRRSITWKPWPPRSTGSGTV